jgi:transposase-like protein
MASVPQIARAPLTTKQPDSCPHCGGHKLSRRGTRKKKLEIAQLWRCASCKRTFTPGPEAMRNKTYPLRMILSAISDYDTGYTLEETAGRLKTKLTDTFRPRPSRRGYESTRHIAATAGYERRPEPASPHRRRSDQLSCITGKCTAMRTTVRKLNLEPAPEICTGR